MLSPLLQHIIKQSAFLLTHDLDHDTYDIDGTERSEGEYHSYYKEWEKGDLLEFKAY